jgi:hypothetical protein
VNLNSTFLLVLLLAANGRAQIVVPPLSSGGVTQLRSGDFAALDQQQPPNTMPCRVVPVKPVLDFDFVFHSGYIAVMSRREWVRAGDNLTILLRVIPQDHKENSIYMSQVVRVRTLDLNTKGEGEALGGFALGEGRYHVDWLMRDRQSRVCASSWDLDTTLYGKETALRSWIPPVSAQPLQTALFEEEAAVPRRLHRDLLKVAILVNFAPQNLDSAVLDEANLQGLVGILRRIARDPRIGEFSLVACSLATQQILYRQGRSSRVDFPAIGEALKSLHLGVIDAKYAMKNAPAQFVAGLVNEQSLTEKADALIIVGPKSDREVKVPRGMVDSLEDLDRPLFYMNYSARPFASPWRDHFGSLVRQKRGVEYTISTPKDLYAAWSDVIARLEKQARIQNQPETGQ